MCIKIDINCGSFDGEPFNISGALYWACYYGHVQSVQALLANGADPEKKPIHFAADVQLYMLPVLEVSLEVLKTIMNRVVWKHRDDPSLFRLDSCLNAIDIDSQATALHVAADLEDLEVVKYLLQHRANPCIPDMLIKYPYEHARARTPLFYILKREYEMQVDMRYQEQLIKMRRKKTMMRKRQKIREGMSKMLKASAPDAGSPHPPASQV
ncbi:hypothetical protein OROGR_000416 [Orobanche gracilis]